ncbi:Hypothetical predicted protein [Prunus dulcis]|uniref:Uncharacterized protein n=1 Tax=Prunus dulcis TaxID=3755 RepID=A0A5E4EP14_PRUDU|nr:Hypothetical predicted protein [Prunus dulcis]
MSLIGSLDNKSSAASMNPASNSNVTKINSDDLSPKSSVQGNKKKERTAGGSSSATLTSIPPPYTQVLRVRNHHGWKDVAGRSSAAAVSVMEHMLDHGCKREECRKDYGSV